MENLPHRLMVYIDGSNLLERIRDYRRHTDDYTFRINPDKLAVHLIQGYDLQEPIRFYATEPVRGLSTQRGHEERTRFIDSFQRSGHYDVILRSRSKVYEKVCGRPLDAAYTRCTHLVRIPKEIDLDLHLAIDMVGDTGKYDTAFLLSSDSDYTPAVKKIYELFPEKQITNVIMNWYRRSGELMHACKKPRSKYFINLDPDLPQLKD